LVNTCESAIGGVAGYIEKLTLLPAGRTLLGRFLNLDRIAAVAALPEWFRKFGSILSHRFPPFPFISFCSSSTVISNNNQYPQGSLLARKYPAQEISRRDEGLGQQYELDVFHHRRQENLPLMITERPFKDLSGERER
jgi:hypothetical protein